MMGRPKKTDTPPADDNFDPQRLDEAGRAAQQLQQIQTGFNDERDLVNQLLGQAQMAGAFEEFSRTVRTSKLAFVKENKLYRALAGKNTPHGAEKLNGTWEEFCNLLGRSVDQVDRDISNLQTFGEEALESMSRMGIGYRDLRQFRKLPADQRTALIEAAKEGDKDTLLELAEDLIAKHTKEKEALQKELAEVAANSEAKALLIADKDAKINSLTVAAGKKIVADTDWPDALIPLCDQIAAVKREIDHAFSKLETARIAVLKVEMPEDQRPKFEAALMHVAEVYASALASAERNYLKEQVVFAQTLGSFLDMDEM